VGEGRSQPARASFALPEQVCKLILPSLVELNQLLQLFNADSHQGPSRELPVLQPETGRALFVPLVLGLPTSWTEQLMGSLSLSSVQRPFWDYPAS
jgi:hypothetical protein